MMRGTLAVPWQPHPCQRARHAFPQRWPIEPHLLRGKSHVLLHAGAKKLIVGVLKEQPQLLAYAVQIFPGDRL